MQRRNKKREQTQSEQGGGAPPKPPQATCLAYAQHQSMAGVTGTLVIVRISCELPAKHRGMHRRGDLRWTRSAS